MCLYLADFLLVFLTFPLVAARFALYQSSGIVAYFRKISLRVRGCSGKMDWEGK